MTKKTNIAELETRINSLEDQLKRAVADYHNLEKRIAEGRSELTKWAAGDLIMRILPVLDHLETVIQSGRQVLSEQSESKDWFRGVELAVKEFKKVLEEEGLNIININVMDEYDPSLAEAVEIREGENNKVLEIVQTGYNINGKVIRPAKVVVGKKDVTLGNEVTPELDDSGQARMTEEENK